MSDNRFHLVVHETGHPIFEQIIDEHELWVNILVQTCINGRNGVPVPFVILLLATSLRPNEGKVIRIGFGSIDRILQISRIN